MGQLRDTRFHKPWLASFRNALCDVLVRRDKLDEARTLLEETIKILTGLLKEEPGMWYVHGLLARSHSIHAKALRHSGEDLQADEAELRAEKHLEIMSRDAPGKADR